MSVNAAKRYFNILALTSGATTFTTIHEVSIDRKVNEITDSGDADVELSFIAQGVGVTRVTISLRDPVQAIALNALQNATITFAGTDQGGGSAKANVTIAGFTGFGVGERMMHNGIWSQTVTGLAAAGGTNPVTISEF